MFPNPKHRWNCNVNRWIPFVQQLAVFLVPHAKPIDIKIIQNAESIKSYCQAKQHGETRHPTLFVCHTLQWANLQQIWWNDMRGLKPPDFEPFLPLALWRCPTLLWLREKPRGRRRRRTQRRTGTFLNDATNLKKELGDCKLKPVAPNFYRKSSRL